MRKKTSTSRNGGEALSSKKRGPEGFRGGEGTLPSIKWRNSTKGCGTKVENEVTTEKKKFQGTGRPLQAKKAVQIH